MARRSYSGNAQPTTLAGSITNVSASFTTAAASGYPDGSAGPFVVTLDRGLAGEEKVLVSSRAGTTFTVSTRGYDGTSAVSHANSATVEHTISAVDLDEANGHRNGVSQEHQELVVTQTTAGVDVLTVQFTSTDSGNAMVVKKADGTVLCSITSAAGGTIIMGPGTTGPGVIQAGEFVVNNQDIRFVDRGSNAGAAPAGGGYLYVVGGVLRYTGPSGTVTTIAPA